MTEMKRIIFHQPDLGKIEGLSSLLDFRSTAKRFSEEEFESLASGEGVPTGKIHCGVDGGHVLILNDAAEVHFLNLLATSGFARKVRGQTKPIDYVKPWSQSPSPYYPDFLFYTYQEEIAIVEIKSILGMCQDENIAKFWALRSFCEKHGFLFGFLDTELEPFSRYLLPPTESEEEMARYFYETLGSLGGFTMANLKAMLKRFPKNKPSEVKRLVASLVLQDPCLENRYCHDSPFCLNATERATPASFKIFQ